MLVGLQALAPPLIRNLQYEPPPIAARGCLCFSLLTLYSSLLTPSDLQHFKMDAILGRRAP